MEVSRSSGIKENRKRNKGESGRSNIHMVGALQKKYSCTQNTYVKIMSNSTWKIAQYY